MMGEIISMKDDNGKYIFGLLVNNSEGAKTFFPCNSLLWELKDEENIKGKLINKKVEIKFVEE